MQIIGTGTVNIGTNIEHADRVDASHHIYHTQTTITTGATHSDDVDNTVDTQLSSTPLIRFAGKRGQKIDLYRVILALLENGFFTDLCGAKPTQKEVFEAFGQMLGADFSDFRKNLSEAVKNNNDSPASTQIFEDLKNSWLSYENK